MEVESKSPRCAPRLLGERAGLIVLPIFHQLVPIVLEESEGEVMRVRHEVEGVGWGWDRLTGGPTWHGEECNFMQIKGGEPWRADHNHMSN
jgi:hypothetical protein